MEIKFPSAMICPHTDNKLHLLVENVPAVPGLAFPAPNRNSAPYPGKLQLMLLPHTEFPTYLTHVPWGCASNAKVEFIKFS